MDSGPRISLSVSGKPVPKGRPRMGRGRVYTPKTTVEYEERIAQAWRDKYGDLSLGARIHAFLYFGTTTHHNTDLDNLVKSALDGLQRGGAFVNGDEQVYEITASKFPTTREEQTTIIHLRFHEYDD